MSRRLFPLAITLGLVSAVGPFAIDMYLPAFPAIEASLGTTMARVQQSLLAFFAATGLCQLVYGPVSDRVGRKPPLYVGMVLYAIGSIGCALAPTIDALIAFRVVQGVGACAGMVIPRAIVRDLHTGAEAARLMSMLMLVFSVAPILAPITGSYIIEWTSWRGVFWVVTLAAGLASALVAFRLPETRGREARVRIGVGAAVRGYGRLLADASFLMPCLVGAFGVSSFFLYLTNASFVMIQHYGLTPRQFSFVFAVNAISFIGMAQFNGLLTARHGLKRVVRGAAAGYVAFMTGAFLVHAAGFQGLAPLVVILLFGYGCLGLLVPTSAVLAMEEQGSNAGSASALLGALQMATGASVAAIVSVFLDGTARPMLAGVALCSIVSFAIAAVALRRRGPRD